MLGVQLSERSAFLSYYTDSKLTERMLTGEVVGTTNPSSKYLGKQYRMLRTGSM